jgi:hypothetical protein
MKPLKIIDDRLVCEDCGEPMEMGTRRCRCPICGKLVCGWCRNHVHNELVQSCVRLPKGGK